MQVITNKIDANAIPDTYFKVSDVAQRLLLL